MLIFAISLVPLNSFIFQLFTILFLIGLSSCDKLDKAYLPGRPDPFNNGGISENLLKSATPTFSGSSSSFGSGSIGNKYLSPASAFSSSGGSLGGSGGSGLVGSDGGFSASGSGGYGHSGASQYSASSGHGHGLGAGNAFGSTGGSVGGSGAFGGSGTGGGAFGGSGPGAQVDTLELASTLAVLVMVQEQLVEVSVLAVLVLVSIHLPAASILVVLLLGTPQVVVHWGKVQEPEDLGKLQVVFPVSKPTITYVTLLVFLSNL